MRILLALVATALAVRVDHTTRPCPLDGSDVRVFTRVSDNRLGGWDSDLASYSDGDQWRRYAIATCPEDLFTVYGQDIDQPLTPAQARAVRQALEQARAGLPPVDDLEVWHRYELAAATYAALGRDDGFIGELYLRAAWTVRDEAVGFYAGLQGPVQARGLLDAGPAELAKPHDPATRRLLLYNLARVAYRGGYIEERDRYLQMFAEAGPVTEEERRALARFREAVELEPRYLRLARTHFVRWLESGAQGVEAARVRYIVADIDRRLGDHQAAFEGFQAVAADPDAPDQLVELARFLGAELAPGGP